VGGRLLRTPLLLAIMLAVFATARYEARGSAETRFGSACGVERWNVKVLMDREAAAAARGPAVNSTVSRLVSLHTPSQPEALTARAAPFETTLWRVQARLVGYRLEPDSDFHVVLVDLKTGQSMLAEIPAPYCTNSPWGTAFRSARAVVESIGHHAAERLRFWWLDYHGATPPEVTVTGVGFWDTEHGQRGASKNGAELHPVISVSR